MVLMNFLEIMNGTELKYWKIVPLPIKEILDFLSKIIGGSNSYLNFRNKLYFF